jgi:uncharacterized protein YcbK (DUF882 family)
MSIHIADYILESEYVCKHCKKYPPDYLMKGSEPEVELPYVMLFKHFKDIREKWGKPIPINSGYRCPKYNEKKGGKPQSIHLFGLALDLECKDDDEVEAMKKVISQVAPDLRRGVYTGDETFIHIDCGYYIFPRIYTKWRRKARWTG